MVPSSGLIGLEAGAPRCAEQMLQLQETVALSIYAIL